MNKKALLTILLIILPLSLWAQREKKVEAEYTYIVPENVTREQARRIALERAQLQAIADEFGTMVSQSNTMVMTNENGKSTTDFLNLSSSDVRGEWVETLEGPKYEQGFTEDDMMWVKVTVKGRIREIIQAATEFDAKIIGKYNDLSSEKYDFKNGESMYLSFQSPAKGYIAAYLYDNASGNVYCLLPYMNDADGQQEVKNGNRYVFFSKNAIQKGEDKEVVDEYELSCGNGGMETNEIYILFSTKAFTKANDNAAGKNDAGLDLPRELSFNDFQRWLNRSRSRDKEMQVEKKTITISK